jgi:hypothetical protein
MNIDSAIRKRIQKGSGQNTAIGDHKRNIGPVRLKLLQGLGWFDSLRLKNGEAPGQSEFLDWRKSYLVSAPRGFVRLGVNGDHFVAID